MPVEELNPFRKVLINPASTAKIKSGNWRQDWLSPWDWP